LTTLHGRFLMQKLLRVAVHAPDQLSITGLVHYLDTCPDLVSGVWSESGTSADVGLIALDRSVDVAAFTRLRAGKRMPVVLVADQLTDTEVRTATRYGVVRILSRTALCRSELVTSVLLAAMGAPQAAEPRDRRESDSRFEAATESRHSPVLQAREADVLRLLADGLETQEIASKLCYSERTVKNIISKLMHRLEFRGRTQAVAYAVRMGAI
jgi:DNA-binding NarL/FixJ family response regulator